MDSSWSWIVFLWKWEWGCHTTSIPHGGNTRLQQVTALFQRYLFKATCGWKSYFGSGLYSGFHLFAHKRFKLVSERVLRCWKKLRKQKERHETSKWLKSKLNVTILYDVSHYRRCNLCSETRSGRRILGHKLQNQNHRDFVSGKNCRFIFDFYSNY